MSSSGANNLNRILLGSAIGAVIGLVLLALGVAILWNAADQKLADAPPETKAVSASPAAPAQPQPAAEAASPTPYPAVAPTSSTPPVPVPVEPPRLAATSIWRSIFDDGDEQAEAGAPAPARAASPAAAPRPTPRPATPRRPPEAQRQDDSLFF